MTNAKDWFLITGPKKKTRREISHPEYKRSTLDSMANQKREWKEPKQVEGK